MKTLFRQIPGTNQVVKTTTTNGKKVTVTVQLVDGKIKEVSNKRDVRIVANSFIKSLSNSNNG